MPAPASSHGNAILTTNVTLTSAQLKNLVAAPITVVDAPGAGHVVVPIEGALVAGAGTTAYTITSAPKLAVFYADGTLSLIQVSLEFAVIGIPSIVYALAPLPAGFSSGGEALADVANRPLQVRLDGAVNMTDGDFPLALYLSYRIVSA